MLRCGAEEFFPQGRRQHPDGLKSVPAIGEELVD